MRFWPSFLSHLEAIFVHVDVKFWLPRGFAFDVLLGTLVFFGLPGGGNHGTDFLYCFVAFVFVCQCSSRASRDFSCWDLFNRFAHSAGPGTETQHSELDAASSTQRERPGGVTSARGRDQRQGA